MPKDLSNKKISDKQDKKIAKDNISKITEGFREHLNLQGKSPTTIKSYMGDITCFINFLNDTNISFDGNLNKDHILSFRIFMIEGSYRAATISTKMNSLKSLNNYLIDNKLSKEIVVNLQQDKVTNASLAEIRRHE